MTKRMIDENADIIRTTGYTEGTDSSAENDASTETLEMIERENEELGIDLEGLEASDNAGIQDSISRLGYQLDSCCCSIKTQMLQDKYDRLYEQYRSVQTDASNAAQSQYLLGVMGKWIANPAAPVICSVIMNSLNSASTSRSRQMKSKSPLKTWRKYPINNARICKFSIERSAHSTAALFSFIK